MKLVFTVFFVIAIFQLNAQTTQDSTVLADPNTIYDMVDVPTEPIGGMSAFYQTIGTNLRYPADARQQNITGKVIVQFIIEKDGTFLPENVKVARSVFKSLDDEASRVVLLTSPWKPGMKNGQPVRTRKTLPISFNLGQSPKSRN